jgi:hypothetical protein
MLKNFVVWQKKLKILAYAQKLCSSAEEVENFVESSKTLWFGGKVESYILVAQLKTFAEKAKNKKFGLTESVER